MVLVVSILGVAAWIYLVLARGQFWRCSTTDRTAVPEPASWPSVAIVVPARDEASSIAAAIGSLLAQNYPGKLRIIVVDDDSRDGTADVVRSAATGSGRGVEVISTQGPPHGWTGKLWALKQGVAVAEKTAPDYLLFADADIVHAPDLVRSLVARAVTGNFVLTSLMVKLRCDSFAERMHVPAFIHFFQMLYPFAWANDPASRVAAAAGGCMLIKADALTRCGGLDSVRNALIDDCSLAAKLKIAGPTWLGLTERAHSIRPYPAISDIRRMISRSAYVQLRYSPWLLAGTTIAMLMIFVFPPLLALFASGAARWLGVVTWLTMAATYLPILRFYRLSPLWAPFLPVTALFFTAYTLDSAYRHYRRRGGEWKGRVHAGAPSLL